MDARIEERLRETGDDDTVRIGLLVAHATPDTARGPLAKAAGHLLPIEAHRDEIHDWDVLPSALLLLAQIDLLRGDPAQAWPGPSQLPRAAAGRAPALRPTRRG
ncbi:hypothetical protein [Streptomyces sp. NPDC093089]|uniref:hypothetical protein n=1 Tax=Streptomyces sp. NPDC093089 TaxID=3366024 RepID=UPI00382F679F